MSEQRVKVTNHPGYEDFEGVLLVGGTHPDGWPFVVVGFEWEGKREAAVVHRDNVTLLNEGEG